MKVIRGQEAVCELGLGRVARIQNTHEGLKIGLRLYNYDSEVKFFDLSEIKLVAINYQETFIDFNDEELHFIIDRMSTHITSDDDYDDLLKCKIIQKINSFKESE